MELCMDTGWSDDHVLHMPAIRFFAFKKAHAKIRDQRMGLFYSEMCDIAAIPNQSVEFHKNLKTHYRGWYADEATVARIKNPRVFDIGTPDDQTKVESVFKSLAKYMR